MAGIASTIDLPEALDQDPARSVSLTTLSQLQCGLEPGIPCA
jgi:hypothetical protein